MQEVILKNLKWLFLMIIQAHCAFCTEFERHPNDGWFNNLVHPDWGAVDTHLLRLSPVNYSDGVYEPSGKERPNPFIISQIAFNGPNRLSSYRNRNALLVYYGQQLVEEVLDAQRPGCPIEMWNIPVPRDHQYNPHNKDNLEMPFRRARYDQRTGASPNNPRQQLNEITPFIDGTLVYGHGKAIEDAIRSFKDGQLATNTSVLKNSFPIKNDIRLPYANPPSPRDHTLRPVSRFRRYANPRTHENPFLLSLGTVWFRYHNHIATRLKRINPSWDDETLFLAARKRVIAQYQKITLYEWLPVWLKVDRQRNLFDMSQYPYAGGGLNKYAGYDPNIHPGISTEFQAAAMRFGHTLVPSGIRTKRITNTCFDSQWQVKAKFTTNSSQYSDGDTSLNVTGIRLCNSYWVPEETAEQPHGIDEIVRGMFYTRAGAEDNVLVSDLREEVFGSLDWSRRDLGAINIQRGRDMGLADYNTVRAAFGLERINYWENINSKLNKEIIPKLKSLYGNSTSPDNLDVFLGGLLETTPDGPGELFRAILLDQFLRIRHGDRFWYENKENGLFTDEEIQEINRTTFFDVLNSVTRFYNREIMRSIDRTNVFLCNNGHGSDCACVDFDDDIRVATTSSSQSNVIEKCTPLKHYDYFSGSEGPFIFTALLALIAFPVTFGIMYGCVQHRGRDIDTSGFHKQALPQLGPDEFYATEWVGRTANGLVNSRPVRIELDEQRCKIKVVTMQKLVVRMLDLRSRQRDGQEKPRATVTNSCDKGYKMMLLAIPGEIDLVLYFSTSHERDRACERLRLFFNSIHYDFSDTYPKLESAIWKDARTIDTRKEVLAKFFKRVVSELSDKAQKNTSLSDTEEEALQAKLTRTEFADALGLQLDSLFVKNMFLLVDSSRDGFVSFEEFKAYFGILCSGSADMKAEMFFNMFDTARSGRLSKENYKKMIKSLMEINNEESGTKVDINLIVDRIFSQMGKDQQGYVTLEEFKKIMLTDSAELWQYATLNLEVDTKGTTTNTPKDNPALQRAQSVVARYSKRKKTPRTQSVFVLQQANLQAHLHEPPSTEYGRLLQSWTRYIDNHSLQIFWVTLYVLVTIGIFIERAHFYARELEHGGLRRLVGYGVSVTRGAASAQMFTFASLLVTMCRNTLTFFRETFLNRFIPFDNMHDMHIIIAYLAIFLTVMHVAGHLINFYHISTQDSSDLNCFFREYFRSSDELASFQYWAYGTMTGLTGILLVFVLVVMYVFAIPYARRNLFLSFRWTHRLYIVAYILMFLHGGVRLVQAPLWGNFLGGPLVIFLFDKLISLSREKVLLPVRRAKFLPSDVINLVFKRPLTFNYFSGQWVRIACPALGENEFHPFTLTSSPHEDFLSLHIRVVGPWTKNLRHLFKSIVGGREFYPKIYVDGPFGESHQDWYKFPVAVLVGAGIGITPFASILKDIASRTKSLVRSRLPCQKVYFIWVTRTQRHFEWMTDIIRQVEATDHDGFVDVHICITQLKEKFDLRTTMLYICERHFQKIAGLSMFTGLRAKTHFGRPKFTEYFQQLKIVHSDVRQIGIFSCGPAGMTRSVNLACVDLNALTGPSLIHHYENF